MRTKKAVEKMKKKKVAFVEFICMIVVLVHIR